MTGRIGQTGATGVTRTLTASYRYVAEHGRLTSPGVGMFEPVLAVGAIVRPGEVIGWLDVLGARHAVIAPANARGVVRIVLRDDATQVAVDHDRALYIVDEHAAVDAGPHADAAVTTTSPTDGMMFRAPTSGRFYGRPSPDKPAFVEIGAELAVGTTVCLLEVMKTFHRVTYGGANLPARARVRAVLVIDGADVNAGDPLVALEP